jgi:hypothetical protein
MGGKLGLRFTVSSVSKAQVSGSNQRTLTTLQSVMMSLTCVISSSSFLLVRDMLYFQKPDMGGSLPLGVFLFWTLVRLTSEYEQCPGSSVL